MRLPPFRLERYFAAHEFTAPHLLGCSDCETLTVGDLLAMSPGAAEGFKDLRLGYTEARGNPNLRERIAGLYAGISPEQVLVHTGAEEAIYLCMQELLGRGDHVVVQYPCYQSLVDVARSLGCEVTLWEGRAGHGWVPELEFLEDHLRPETRLVVINNPHNPTGGLLPRGAFDDLVKLSEKHGFVLFSDEVYRQLEYREKDRLPAVCEVSPHGISLGVMSKAFGLAGLRIGWIVTRDRECYAQVAAHKDYTTICNSAPAEFLATVALSLKERLLQKNLEIIRSNLQCLDVFFHRYADLFEWVPPQAGPIAFPRWKRGPVDNFCRQLLERAGVLLLPGSLYDRRYADRFRIGFGRRSLPAALAAMEAFLREAYPRGA